MHGISTTQQLKLPRIINWCFHNITKNKPKMTKSLFPYLIGYILTFIEIVKQFNCIDASKDGNITFTEFTQYCNKHALELCINEDPSIVFYKIDNNNSGNITLDEFCNYIIKLIDSNILGDCIIEIMKKKR